MTVTSFLSKKSKYLKPSLRKSSGINNRRSKILHLLIRKHPLCLISWRKELTTTYCYWRRCMKSFRIDMNKKSFCKSSSTILMMKNFFKRSFRTSCIILTTLILRVFQLYWSKSSKWIKLILDSSKPQAKRAVHLAETETSALIQKTKKVPSFHTI